MPGLLDWIQGGGPYRDVGKPVNDWLYRNVDTPVQRAIGPHATNAIYGNQGQGGLLPFAAEMNPAADVRDMMQGSREISGGILGGDPMQALAGGGLLGAAMLGTVTPGPSAGGLRAAAIRFKGKTYAGKTHQDAVAAATDETGEYIHRTDTDQGYIASNGKFIDRNDPRAGLEALSAGQITDPVMRGLVESDVKNNAPYSSLVADYLDFGASRPSAGLLPTDAPQTSGFVPNKGRSKDFAISETMLRPARSQ